MEHAIDEQRLQDLVGQMVNDMGVAAAGPLVLIGEKLGIYRALARGGAQTSEALAARAGLAERYVREWCSAQAGFGYISYDARNGQFYLTPEQRAVFADEDSATYMLGGYHSVASLYLDEPVLSRAFRTGDGVAWGEHSECLFCGTEKFFRPGYVANLLDQWLPALDGVVDKLINGARVADVGCGHGISTLLMAERFPRSEFVGYDFHPKSIERARALAAEQGLSNVHFEVKSAKGYPAENYDLITFFDCLHDMGDPVGAARQAFSALAPDGTVMLVEPFAEDRLEDNLNPVGRLYYTFSTMVCTPASLSQEVGLALGAQAGEKRLREVLQAGGFSHVRRATQTPFNLILEARIRPAA